MTSLVSHPKGLVFSDLKELCALTDGNLSRHLQVLHEAGLIEVSKGFHRNRPQTVCRITDEGQTPVPRIHQRPRKRRSPTPSASTKPAPAPASPFTEGWSPA